MAVSKRRLIPFLDRNEHGRDAVDSTDVIDDIGLSTP